MIPEPLPGWGRFVLLVVGTKIEVKEFAMLGDAVKAYREMVIDIQKTIEQTSGLTTPKDVRSKSLKFEYAITVALYAAPQWRVVFQWSLDQ
jgi:hypothetical protein